MRRMKKWIAVLLLAALALAPLQAQASLADKLNALVGTTCKKGDSGPGVLNLKKKLQSYGYFTPGSSLSEDFNDTTVQRVKLFQENNGLTVNGEIDTYTLNKLKSSYGVIYGEYYKGSWPEPDVTAIIPYYSAQSREKGSDLEIRIKIKNVSTTRTVSAVELLVYATDVWNEDIISKEYPMSFTIKQGLGPGKMAYTEYCRIPCGEDTYKYYAAIRKVRYSDGTTASVSVPDYHSWTRE